MTPHVVEEFVGAFREEVAARQRQALGSQAQLLKDLTDVGRRLEGVLRAVEPGVWNTSLRKRLDVPEARKAAIQRQLVETQKPPPAVHLTADAMAIYRAEVADLEASLTRRRSGPRPPRGFGHWSSVWRYFIPARCWNYDAIGTMTLLGAGVGWCVIYAKDLVAGTRNHLDLLLTG